MNQAEPVLPPMTEIWQQTLNWQPSGIQQEQFQRFYELILQGNRQFNLTRITDPLEFWEKHLWDSLRGIAFLWQEPHALSFPIIDIGTGAGFPGVPVAIALPHATVTLLDSTRKKIAFLETTLRTLGIENCQTLSDRVEQVGQDPTHREAYHLALVRAVASAPVCAEYALPLLKMGGSAVLYRGQWTAAETQALQSVVAQLGGAIAAIDAFTTPLTEGMRHCVYLQKVHSTPAEFPRPVGIPAQRSL